MKLLQYRILLWKEAEDRYTVIIPTLPNCVTFGGTIEEAIEVYLEDLTDRGEEIPTEEDTLEYTLTVETYT
ncbi:type II toxin-antitoxin system HicB family antitoxin [Methanofollis tationis]|uniref:Type II toxin-antitoxin system HicB family antitoxin n=1 Tax=Methanofollis tationis TaxID=81417 RepID=A0A7K4HPA9_9EURY|nr:type II toxin-antitoxin system HicB family antitoxin [Methanofollis tationis]NVO66740.1 type II toxin-antitoxin system HicB family antitoxin [Methanofollis tationis]